MPNARRGALFMNPSSGTADARRAGEIRAAAEGEGLDVLELSKELDVQAEIRQRIDRGQKLFVAAGGDGTINTVLQPLVGTEAVLGVLPVGTWNHFAKDLEIPLDWREALEVAVRGTTLQVDVGRINDRFFANNVSIGLYPELVQHRERYRHMGKWTAYLRAGRAALEKFPHVALSFQSAHHLDSIEAQIFMVSVNPYNLGGKGVLARRAALDSGMLAVYWLPRLPKLDFVRTVARYLRGRMSPETVRTFQTTQVHLSTRKKLAVGMDGELRHFDPPVVVSVVRRSLLVRAPRGR